MDTRGRVGATMPGATGTEWPGAGTAVHAACHGPTRCSPVLPEGQQGPLRNMAELERRDLFGIRLDSAASPDRCSHFSPFSHCHSSMKEPPGSLGLPLGIRAGAVSTESLRSAPAVGPGEKLCEDPPCRPGLGRTVDTQGSRWGGCRGAGLGLPPQTPPALLRTLLPIRTAVTHSQAHRRHSVLSVR